ncbi:hypothetical protein OP10G_4603 [Fimbriimonas ginsengisoli Gsoil 348]|uniref:Uncharacterized protein n=1 Tax=Fimbriimonas ginsengisoli Gsoil 348 TaxID=661478 RepID=A0A068NX07_FIMGI|nr:hypothetical protein OP10G_4603 [Fimbriimonas ginsengisoli Gsoil 348]
MFHEHRFARTAVAYNGHITNLIGGILFHLVTLPWGFGVVTARRAKRVCFVDHARH